MSQVNEFIGQVSELNRVKVTGGKSKRLKKSRRGKRNEREDGSVMDPTPSDTSIAISLSVTADTAMVASQVAADQQSGISRNQLNRKLPIYRSASDFFGEDYDE